MAKRLLTILLLLCGKLVVAQNYLPSHLVISQKVSQGYFTKRSTSIVIPTDNQCITATEAKTWLNINNALVPTDGRLPWYSELVPVAATPPTVVSKSCVASSVISTGRFSNTYEYLYSDGTTKRETVMETKACAL